METRLLSLEVPAEWAAMLTDRTRVLEVLTLGLEEYRIRQALTLYRAGGVSLGYAAQQAGIPERVLLEVARQRGVAPIYDDNLFLQDIGA
jgi:predicted HTH domain antitoxin